MADDYSADITTKGRLSINGQARGSFEASADRDWFAVTLSANTTYLFSMESVSAAGGVPYDVSSASLAMFDSRGGQYAYSSNYGQPPLLQFTPSTSGTYYLSAQAGYQQATGGYRVTSSLPEADEFPADTSTTATLSSWSGVTGSFQRLDDVDWIRFYAEAGQVIVLSTEFGGKTSSDGYFSIYDSTGQYSQSAYNGVFKVKTSGDYYLALNAGNRLGAYTQTMEVIADDYSSDDSRPGQLLAGAQTTGSIDYYGDTDRFQMQLEAGSFYTLRLGPQTANLSFTIYNGNGNYVSTSDSYADGATTVQFQARESGTYSIDVGNYSSAGKPLPYTLSLSSPAADDFGDTQSTAHVLALDETVAGRLQARGDVDMFSIVLSAGTTYRFDLPFSDNYSFYNNVRLIDSNGNSLRNSYSQGETFSYTPTKDGIVYLSMSSSGSTTPNDYSVKVSAVQDDYGANAASAGKLSVGAGTKGVLEAGGGDIDWYAITLNAGAYYWFTLAGARESGGTLSGDAKLRVLDAQGNVVATGDSSYYATAALLPYTAPARGTYYVEVSAPGNAGTYTVKAQLGEKDDHGNDAAHASVIQDKVALAGKLELVTDKDVFKLSAVAGMSYALEVAPTVANSSFSNTVSLSVSNGDSYVQTNEVYGTGKILKYFTAATAGDYYLTLSNSIFGNNGSNGAYQISVKSQGLDDYTANKLTTGLLTLDTPLRGELGTPGDTDWVKVRLEAGRTYVFDMQGSVSGGGTLNTGSGSATLRLLTAEGSFEAYSSSNNLAEPRISYIATRTGDYFLEIYSYSQNTGSYTVVATQTSGDVIAPQLLSSTLTDGAVNVAPTQKIALTFSESIMVGTGITVTDSNGVVLNSQSSQQLMKVVGKTLLMDQNVALQPGMSYKLSLPEGSVLDLAGNPWAGAHSYSFTVTAPVTTGTAGNDYLLGSSVGATTGLVLDGGAGIDTVYYGGARYNWQMIRNTDSSATVSSYYGYQQDKLSGVERLLFANGGYALDIDGAGGQVYRLYQAAFGRTPDMEGLGFWIAARDKGVGLQSVANDFVQSAEFGRLYGSAPSDAEFVRLLYNNVLHRTPDAAGNSFWLEGLANGASRAAVLTDFSESAENVAALATIIGNGFSYTPYGG